MSKINGYTEEEAKTLVEFIKEGKSKGKTLTYLFEAYGLERGRAKGSVRNYYYTLMKNAGGDERIVKMLDGSSLTVEKIKEFTEEETDEALKSILAEKSKGVSVRKAIFRLSGGDDKLMLRLQNKYRNTLKKEPARIVRLATEMGLYEEASELRSRTEKKGGQSFLQRRLENEINALYDRLTRALKEENARLLEELQSVKAENEQLKKGS